MKLRTGLQVGALFPLLMAILVSIGLVLRSQELERVTATLGKADTMVREVSRLQAATHNHLALRCHETDQAWWARHDELGALLGDLNFESILEQLCVERVRDGHSESERIMRQLSRDLTAETTQRLLDRDKDLVLDLSTQLEQMTSEAFRLARVSHENAVDTHRETDYVVAPLFGVLALSMAAGVLMISKRITRRFTSIRRGMGAITSGDYEVQMSVKGDDEIDQVMDAFNRMNRQLKDSNSALNDQINKHEGVAEALRRSNMVMSDALVKLKRAQAQIVDGERLSALRQMAGGIAHDFNSTLTPILGLSDYMMLCPESLDNREDLVENISIINQAVRQARDQVKRLTEFFRPIEETTVEDVNMNDVIKRAVDLTKPRWKDQAETKGVEITVEVNSVEVPAVRADEFALREVIANLIINSVEAMPKGGRITITPTGGTRSLSVTIADTGEGMPEEVQRKCTEPFFSTKGNDSAGMGLTSASAIVRRYDGNMTIESNPGKGSSIRFELPTNAGSLPGVDYVEAEGDTDLPKLTMLVVDDELWVRQVFTRAFGSEGHIVETACDGMEGLDKFKAGEFDVVILDRAMPKMSGDDVALAIKKENSKTPIILLTGFGDIMNDEGEMPEGIDLIVSKPATLAELRASIAKVLRS